MKLAMKLSCIILSSLYFSFYCAERKFNTDKITHKSFSTGMPIGKQKIILEEQKRIEYITILSDCIHAKQLIPTKIIFAADNDISAIALRHNQSLSDQALQKK